MGRMNPKGVGLLIREGEGLTVEFKEKYSSRIDEDIVAFANAKGGAILLGVRDDKTVMGEKLTNDLKARINSLARHCKPSIAVNLARVDNVVVVEVAEGSEKPYSCGSGYFRRLNGTTQKMGHEEIRLMFRENDPLPFEERTVKGFAFDDVSRPKVLAFTKEAGVSIGKTETVDFLRSLKVSDETVVKNAGILFFAQNVPDYLPQAQMTLVAFKGITKGHVYDRLDVRDDLLTQFNQAILFLKRHLNVRSEIKGVNRYDIYEIPFEALREAVVNALMHRDYSITGTQVSVEVYDDRVEVVNPGGLPRGLTRKTLGTISVRRNELIADLFFRLDKVERLGQGIQNMKSAMLAAGLNEPTFETNGFFRAVFYRSPEFSLKGSPRIPEKVVGKSGQMGGRKKWSELTEKQAAVLESIRANPEVSRKKLAQSLSINPSAVQKHIEKLKHRGFIRRVGPDKGGRWEIIG